MAKKKATKREIKTNFDWLSHFNKAQTRKTIVSLLNVCMDDEFKIDAKATPEQFAEQVLGICPDAYKFLPESLVPDAERRKVLQTLNKLAEPDDNKIWYRRDNKAIPPAVLALMSRGVKSLDFQYIGGWDETNYDEGAPAIEFYDGVLNKADDKILNGKDWKKSDAFRLDLFAWVKEETNVEAQDILYAFLDDSGAGDGNTYSQMMKLDLEKWKISLHDFEEDESDDDYEEEGEE